MAHILNLTTSKTDDSTSVWETGTDMTPQIVSQDLQFVMFILLLCDFLIKMYIHDKKVVVYMLPYVSLSTCKWTGQYLVTMGWNSPANSDIQRTETVDRTIVSDRIHLGYTTRTWQRIGSVRLTSSVLAQVQYSIGHVRREKDYPALPCICRLPCPRLVPCCVRDVLFSVVM